MKKVAWRVHVRRSGLRYLLRRVAKARRMGADASEPQAWWGVIGRRTKMANSTEEPGVVILGLYGWRRGKPVQSVLRMPDRAMAEEWAARFTVGSRGSVE